MKKLTTLMFLTCFLALSFVTTQAQDSNSTAQDSNAAVFEEPVQGSTPSSPPIAEEDFAPIPESSFHQVVKDQFIAGGWQFMSIILLCLILGLAIAIERIITLNLATTNTKKLLAGVEGSLSSGGVTAAKELCKNTKGPVASIFTQGLMRMSEGIGMVEKSIISYGSVEMGKLEKGMVWISLFISLAPMLGFMGTVIGMISAFDDIAEANTINASIVAGGIKIALITTVSGLIVAIILQVFYNYILSKIDSIVLDMEEASMDLVDILYKRKLEGKK